MAESFGFSQDYRLINLAVLEMKRLLMGLKDMLKNFVANESLPTKVHTLLLTQIQELEDEKIRNMEMKVDEYRAF